MRRGLVRKLASVAVLALTVLVPAQAIAAGEAGKPPAPTLPVTTPSGPTGPSGTTKPKPKPKPAVRAHPRLYLLDSFFVNRQPVTLPKRLIHLDGVVFPYVKGQWVRVRIFFGRHLVKSANWRLRPSRNGRFGQFRLPFSSPGVGSLTIEVSHRKNREMR